MLMVLEMAPETKGCTAAIMRMWLSTESARLPMRPQGLAQSKTGRCSSFRCGAPSSVMAPQTWRLAASISARRKAERLQHVEIGRVERFGIELQRLGAEVLAQRPLVEDEADVEGRFQAGLDGGDLLLAEALVDQRLMGEAGGHAFQRAVADGIGDDVVDLRPGCSRASAALRARSG